MRLSSAQMAQNPSTPPKAMAAKKSQCKTSALGRLENQRKLWSFFDFIIYANLLLLNRGGTLTFNPSSSENYHSWEKVLDTTLLTDNGIHRVKIGECLIRDLSQITVGYFSNQISPQRAPTLSEIPGALTDESFMKLSRTTSPVW